LARRKGALRRALLRCCVGVRNSFISRQQSHGTYSNGSSLKRDAIQVSAVRNNAVTGGGRLKYGLGAGDASCNPSGGVGLNSTCSGNGLQ
jgi:hypothetical protein